MTRFQWQSHIVNLSNFDKNNFLSIWNINQSSRNQDLYQNKQTWIVNHRFHSPLINFMFYISFYLTKFCFGRITNECSTNKYVKNISNRSILMSGLTFISQSPVYLFWLIKILTKWLNNCYRLLITITPCKTRTWEKFRNVCFVD